MKSRIPMCLSLVLFSAGFVEPGAAQDIPEIAKKAEAFLTKHCYRCHGEQGSAEGGLNYILNRDRLVESKMLVLTEAHSSLLVQRVVDGDMPADELTVPSEGEIGDLKAWIAEGAPDFLQQDSPRVFLDRKFIDEQISQDLASVSPRQALRFRYITITHLYNQNRTKDELQSYRHAIAKLINSVSWGQQVVPLKPIDEQQTIFRIDLRDFQWSNTIWNQLLPATLTPANLAGRQRLWQPTWREPEFTRFAVTG